MTKRTRHKGPPPHIGWWNASSYGTGYIWRWCDGRQWSIEAVPNDTAQAAAIAATHKGIYQEKIEWTDYYPKNARVPRRKP